MNKAVLTLVLVAIVIVVVTLMVVALICIGFSLRQPAAPSPPAGTGPTAKENPQPPPAEQPEWTTYHGDPALQGVADTSLPNELAVLWRFKAGAPVRETPVVHAGRVFFATARGEVFAIDFNGQKLWSQEFFTGEKRKDVPVREQIDAPLVCADSLVLVGTARGMLYALDPGLGSEKWRTQLDGPVFGAPNYLRVGDDDAISRIFVMNKANATLQCIDPASGSILWRSEEIDRCDGSPAVSPEAIAFGSCDSALHVVSPETGKLLRNIEIGEESQVAGGVALDGDRVFSGSRSGKVVQADVKTGEIVWATAVSDVEVFSTPAVTQEHVVAASNDGNVFALDRASGNLRWRFDTKGAPSSPVIAGNKVIVAADGELFLLDLANGLKLSSVKISDEITSPAVAGNRIFVGSEDGTVVALGAAEEKAVP